MEFKAQFMLKQRWRDERLKFAHLAETVPNELQLAEDQYIWKPDTFFQNEKSGHVHLIDQANFLIRVRPDGEVLHDVRIAMSFSCLMNLRKYPFDVQHCAIEFASYAYTTEDIIYEWDDVPLTVDSKVTSVLPNMVMKSIVNGSCKSKTNTGEYSCLKITVTFVRDFSFFLMQLYVPSGMLVAVSWISYWIDWRASAGRVLLTIVTLLTLIQQSYSKCAVNGISANLPPVSYAKAADIWFGGCVCFVFVSLLEYAVINFVGIRYHHRRWQPYAMIGTQLNRLYAKPHDLCKGTVNPSSRCNYKYESCVNAFEPTISRRRSLWRLRIDREKLRMQTELTTALTGPAFKANFPSEGGLSSFKNTPEIIDKIFRITIPLAFALYNAVYWSLYT